MGTRDKGRFGKSKKGNTKEYPLISLFTGAGGLDLGLEESGFQLRVCIENDKWCTETLKENKPNLPIINEDINDVSAREILEKAGLRVGETVLLSAGPPCQSFSMLGKKGGTNDPRGKLLFKTIDLIRDIKPLVFLVENVEGLGTMQKGKILKEAVKLFNFNNYEVNYEVLNAANYGVPQKRKRVFILGYRKEKRLSFPEGLYGNKKNVENVKNWSTVEETLEKLYSHAGWAERSDNKGFRHSKEMVERMKMIEPGKNFKILPMHMRPKCWKNGKHQGADTFGRMKAGEPALTIRTSAYNPTKGRYIHPWENRGLTTLEMAALQTFPYEYRFKGPLVEIGKQIGNAVPPLLAKCIGESIIEQINED